MEVVSLLMSAVVVLWAAAGTLCARRAKRLGEAGKDALNRGEHLRAEELLERGERWMTLANPWWRRGR